MRHGLRQFARLLKISAILSRYRLDEFLEATHLYRPMRLLRVIAPWGRRGVADKPRGERLRLALQEMGPIYVKFGQIISTRRDLVAPFSHWRELRARRLARVRQDDHLPHPQCT